MLKLIAVFVLLGLAGIPVTAAEQFKDVPKEHWAAESVQKLADYGIVNGYPDGAFKGDQPVTRYEFAAALERFVEFFKKSREPLIKGDKPVAKTAQKTAADNPAESLRDGGFLATDSPILRDPSKPVTTDQMAQALASITKKMIADLVPAHKDEGETKEPTFEPQEEKTGH